jgi:hypothetical protein
LAAGCFCNSEVDDFHLWLAVHQRDENVRGLQVPVDDGFLVCVLDAFADLSEQLEPLGGGQLLSVAVLSNWYARYVFHDEVGSALGRTPTVEHLGDGGVVHERQRLALGVEAGHHLLGVHSRLDELEGYLPPRLQLLGEPHLSHATFANDVEEAVRADLPSGLRLRFARSVELRRQSKGVLHPRVIKV